MCHLSCLKLISPLDYFVETPFPRKRRGYIRQKFGAALSVRYFFAHIQEPSAIVPDVLVEYGTLPPSPSLDGNPVNTRREKGRGAVCA